MGLEARELEQDSQIKEQKKKLGEMKIRFELEKQSIYKDSQKNIENQRNMLQLEHQNKISELKITMNKTFDYNRNYLINKYTKEIDEIKTAKGRVTRARNLFPQKEEPKPEQNGEPAGKHQVQLADQKQGVEHVDAYPERRPQ